MICWFTSLLFIPCMIRAIKKRAITGAVLLTSLCTTSCIHHFPLFHVKWLSKIDKILAHTSGIWAIIQGVRHNMFYLLPHAAWSPIMFYVFESRCNQLFAQIIHATIHVSSSIAFTKIINEI